MSAYDPHHGIPFEKEAFLALIETQQPHRYEWRDGMLYAMPGGTAVFGWRGNRRVYRDRYVEIPNHTALLPDLVLTCTPSDVIRPKAKGTNSATIQYPRLIAEVLSDNSTAVYDRREKRELYQRCPTMEVYVLLDQEAAHVMVYRRSTSWQLEQYMEQQVIPFPEFGLSLSLDDLYTDILASVAEALKAQTEEQP
jgi:Putative restriction endonuclease